MKSDVFVRFISGCLHYHQNKDLFQNKFHRKTLHFDMEEIISQKIHQKINWWRISSSQGGSRKSINFLAEVRSFYAEDRIELAYSNLKEGHDNTFAVQVA